MTELLYTIPSFSINKKEFLRMWVMNYIKQLNIDVLKAYNEEKEEFLLSFGLLTQEQLDK